MPDATFTDRGPAIAMLELSSIARGVEALDAMLKKAGVDVLLTTIVPRGKYVILIGGSVADVEQSYLAGRDVGGSTVLDHFLIPSAHPQLPAAVKGRVKVGRLDAVGMIETKEIASAIHAADAAAKAAGVVLIEARNQPGGKGLVVMTGNVSDVRAAVDAGIDVIRGEGLLVHHVVIPRAHDGLLPALTS